MLRLRNDIAAQQAVSQRADSALAASLMGVMQMLRTVSDSLQAQQQLLTQVRGDTRVELYNIQQQLVAIQELTGQSQQRLSELRSQLEQRSPAAPDPGAQPMTPDSARPSAGTVPAAEQLMDVSLQQLRRGSPGTARAGLAEFLRQYPSHPRVVDALYFTGEAWAAEQRADSAAVWYRAVLQRFPQSPRAPSSQYKLGLQALAAGRTSEARDAFNRVVGTYPSSEEASLARERLRSLPR